MNVFAKKLRKNKIIVLDIETTGFEHDKDCILELGIVELDLTTGSIKELLDVQFKEEKLGVEPYRDRHLNAWIFENEFMSHEDIRGKLPFSHHKEAIQNILDPYEGRITAWNRGFDVGFLESRGLKIGNKLTDPMRDSADYFQLPHKRGGFGKWASAQEAWDILFPDVEKIELHRGLDDSIMEAKIIYELIDRDVYRLNLK